MQELEKLISQLDCNDFFNTHFSDYQRHFELLFDEIENDEIRITVIGEFSAGKSTFLNALMGMDILSHNLSETTATITSIHNVPLKDQRINTIQIKFSNGDIKQLSIDKNTNMRSILQKYTTKDSDIEVVTAIESVSIYLNFMNRDQKVVFIDTPGLNGMSPGHTELTLNEIRKSHLSICLFGISGLKSSYIDFLNLTSQYQTNIIFVQNFIDQLHASEGETSDTKLIALKNDIMIKIPVFTDPIVFPVSGLKALAGRDISIKKIYASDIFELTSADRKRFIKESHIENLENYIWQEIVEKQHRKILEESISLKMNGLVNELKSDIENQISLFKSKLDLSQRDEIISRLKDNNENSEKNWSNIENFIDSRKRDLEKLCRNTLEIDIDIVKAEVTERINVVKDYDELVENFYSHSYTKFLNNSILNLKGKYSGFLSEQLEDILQNAIVRVQEFSPKISLKTNDKGNFHITFEDINSFEEDLKNERQKKQEEIILAQDVLKEKIHYREKIEDEKSKTEKREKSANSSLRELENQYNHQKSNLGNQPGVEIRYETRTRKEYRGGFGVIDFFCGPKEIQYTEKVEDSSARDRWENTKREIEGKYKSAVSEKENYIYELKLQQKQLENILKENSEELKKYEKRVREKEEELNKYKEEQEEFLIKHKHELLRTKKKEIIGKFESTLVDYRSEFVNSINQNTGSAIPEIKRIARNYYKQANEEYSYKLQKLISNFNEDHDIGYIDQLEELLHIVNIIK